MKRRSTPLGCFVALCVILLITMTVITMQLFSLNNEIETHYAYLATRLGVKSDEISVQGTEFKATITSLSGTISVLEYQQQFLVTPIPH